MSNRLAIELDSIPDDWEIKTVLDFAKDETNAIVDGPFGSNLKVVHYRPEGIPVIQSSFVTSNKFVASEHLYVDEAKFFAERRSKVEPGDIVMAKIGAKCGSCAIMPDDHPVGILAGNCLKISVKSEYSNRYLESLLHYYQDTGRLAEITSTTAQPAISMSLLKCMLIPVPPPAIQRKIANILTTVDILIEKTEALIAKYQAIKQGMMHDLFTRGVDAHGQLRPPYEDAPELYKDSELGWIPREWEMSACNDICREIVVGIVIQPSQYYQSWGVPALRSANVRETGIDTTDMVYMSEASNRLLSKSMLRQGDVITVRTGYPGTSCVVPSEFDGANCVDILIARPATTVRSEYLAIWINSDFGKEQVLRKQGGLAQQHFNVSEMKSLLVALPSMEEQEQIESIILTQQARIQSEEAYREKLFLLKTGLMQDLLTGNVRVAVDEPLEITA